MSNRTNLSNKAVHFDGISGNLYLGLRARSHTIDAARVGCSIFQPANFDQTITHQHVLLRREYLFDGTTITIILCLHALSTSHIY